MISDSQMKAHIDCRAHIMNYLNEGKVEMGLDNHILVLATMKLKANNIPLSVSSYLTSIHSQLLVKNSSLFVSLVNMACSRTSSIVSSLCFIG